MDYTPQIAAIRTKLDLARTRGLQCFGSEHHGFRWNDPLPEADVAAFEAEHGITLPGPYRAFLTLAGNGGAGPYYGILPLERWADAAWDITPDLLARPALIRPDLPARQNWDEALGCPEGMALQGTISVVDQGCTYYSLLIITGPDRGRIVNIDLSFTPAHFCGDRDFLAWYERWLDELLAGWETSWFGRGLPGDEAAMVAALADPNRSADDRAEALWTLGRIPQLRPATVMVVRAGIGDESARVRCLALHLLSRHAGADFIADAIELASDPDATVRSAVVVELARRDDDCWETIAREQLGDNDPTVVAAVFDQLNRADRLTPDDLRALLDHPDATVRNKVLGTNGIGTLAAELPRVLDDPDWMVRRQAIREIGRAGIREATPCLLDRLAEVEAEGTDLTMLEGLISALGDLRDPRATPAVIAASRHADAFVRQDAARALGKLGGPAARAAVVALQDDPAKPHRVLPDGSGSTGCMYTVGEVARQVLAAWPEPGPDPEPPPATPQPSGSIVSQLWRWVTGRPGRG